MSYPAITNPAIPYVSQIPGSLQAGTIIRIQGTPHPSAQCFAINLQCGPRTQPRDDVALHLSPVFTPPPRLVRNSLQGQRWGPEESHGAYFPFSPGQSFEILILTEQERFMIAVNGAHYTGFQHRLPLHSVTHLAIDGQVDISLVNFDNLGHTARSKSPMLGFEGAFPASQPFADSAPLPGGPGYPTGQPSFPQPVGVVPPPYSSQPTAYPSATYPSTTSGYPTQPSISVGYPTQPPVSGGYPTQPPMSGGYPTQPPVSGGYPTQPPMSGGYPTQPAAYPSQQYPTSSLQLPGIGQPYSTQPGTHVVYPHTSPKRSNPIGIPLGAGVAAGAAALAGAALLGRSPHTSMRSNPIGIPLGSGVAAGAAALAGSALLGRSSHTSMRSNPIGIPLGSGVAAGAAALAGAALLGRSPLKHGKKMKKLYKHKMKWHKPKFHKYHHKWHGHSSSSSSEEE